MVKQHQAGFVPRQSQFGRPNYEFAMYTLRKTHGGGKDQVDMSADQFGERRLALFGGQFRSLGPSGGGSRLPLQNILFAIPPKSGNVVIVQALRRLFFESLRISAPP